MKTGSTRQGAFSGVLLASTAFVMWGLSPLFWKQLGAVPSFEIIMHRMVWSFLFLMPLLVILDQWRDFLKTLSNIRTTLLLLGTTLIVGGNWFAFIWAVNHDLVLQASLGYYINPLVNVLLGTIFLKERLRSLQIAAVVIAGCGVLYLTLAYGRFPWVALFLAFSFGFYGLLRKTAPVGALVGLSVETFLLSIPALFYLVYLEIKGVGAFTHMGLKTDLFLSMTALLTALPLLLFTTGARRLNLSTIGFLQYIAPTCSFLLALFVFRETAAAAQMLTFAAIWVALAVFTLDGLLHGKRAAVKSR
jgi:chloramphenicol-sensitive protein RarD